MDTESRMLVEWNGYREYNASGMEWIQRVEC